MGATLLLADDSITIQKVVELTFAETDHQVVAVGNGRDMLARLEEVGPDLILCDVVMPDMNGYEICQRLKSDPTTLHIPVVLLTGTFEPFDRDRALAAGCDAIVTKPFEARELVATVADLLERKQPVEAPSDGEQPEEGLGVPAGVQGIDYTTTGFEEMVPPPPAPEAPPEDGIELTGSAFVSGVTPAPPPAPPELAGSQSFEPTPREGEAAEQAEPEAVEKPEPGIVEGPETEAAEQVQREGVGEGEQASVEERVEFAPAAEVEEAPAEPVATAELEQPLGEQPEEPEAPSQVSLDAARAMAHLEEVERRAREQAAAGPEPRAEDFEFAPPSPPQEAPVPEVAAVPDEPATLEPPPPLVAEPEQLAPPPAGAIEPPPAAPETPIPAPDEPPAPAPDEPPEAITAELPELAGTPEPAEPPAAAAAEPPPPVELPEAAGVESPVPAGAEPVVVEEPPVPAAVAEPPPPAFAEAPGVVPAVAPPSAVSQVATDEPESDAPAPVGEDAGPHALSQDDVDRIARRVLELAEPLLSRIAWEVIPDMAEMLVRQRIRELEEAAEEEA